MPKQKPHFIPRPSDLVPSDEYDTDDSFGESQRQMVTKSTQKKRLEQFATTLAVLERRKASLPPCIDVWGKRVEYSKYAAKLQAQTNAAFQTLQVTTQPHTSKTMPRPSTKKRWDKDEEYVPSGESSSDEVPPPKKPRRSPRDLKKKTGKPATSSPVAGKSTDPLDTLNHSMIDFNLSEPEEPEPEEVNESVDEGW